MGDKYDWKLSYSRQLPYSYELALEEWRVDPLQLEVAKIYVETHLSQYQNSTIWLYRSYYNDALWICRSCIMGKNNVDICESHLVAFWIALHGIPSCCAMCKNEPN